MICTNDTLSVFPYQVGARNEGNNAAYFASRPLCLRGTKPSVSWFNRWTTGSIAQCLLNSGPGWRWKVSCTSRPHFLLWQSSWYQFSKRLGWNFSLTWSFRLHCGPRFDSASKRVPGIFPWGKFVRCTGLTALPPSCAECHEIWQPQPPWTLRACPGLYRDCFTFTLYLGVLKNLSRPFGEEKTAPVWNRTAKPLSATFIA